MPRISEFLGRFSRPNITCSAACPSASYSWYFVGNSTRAIHLGHGGTDRAHAKRRDIAWVAFVVAKFGGNVFARGSYGGKYGGEASGESFGRFLFGRSRLPISKLFSFAPPDCLVNRMVRDAMDSKVEEQAGKVLAREIGAARRGF